MCFRKDDWWKLPGSCLGLTGSACRLAAVHDIGLWPLISLSFSTRRLVSDHSEGRKSLKARKRPGRETRFCQTRCMHVGCPPWLLFQFCAGLVPSPCPVVGVPVVSSPFVSNLPGSVVGWARPARFVGVPSRSEGSARDGTLAAGAQADSDQTGWLVPSLPFSEVNVDPPSSSSSCILFLASVVAAAAGALGAPSSACWRGWRGGGEGTPCSHTNPPTPTLHMQVEHVKKRTATNERTMASQSQIPAR